MNTRINLLSDDALDAVSGGRPRTITEGLPPNPGSIAADGSPGSVSSGGSILQGITSLAGLGVVGVVWGLFGGLAVAGVTGTASTVI